MSITDIEKKLGQLRSHIRLTFLSWGVAKVTIWAALLTLWLYYTDRILQLPGGVRLAFLVAAVVGLVVVAIRSLFYPLSRTLTDEDLALLVEREYPLLNDRLISSLQILKAQEKYKDTASADMIRIMVGEAFDLAGRLRFEQAVRTRRLVVLLGGSILAMGLVFGHAWLDRDNMSIWVRRALGQGPAWPTLTQLDARILEREELPNFPTDDVLNVNFSFAAKEQVDELGVKGVYEVAMGSDLRFVAEPSGQIPDSAEIRIVSFTREAGTGRFVQVGNPNVRPMARGVIKSTDGTERVYFSYNKTNIISPLEQIWIKAGDALAGPFTLRVIPAPELESAIELRYSFPQYLVLAPRTTQDLRMEAVAGTSVDLLFSTTKPLKLGTGNASALVVDFNVGSSRVFPVESNFEAGPQSYRARIPALTMGMARWRLKLVDDREIENARRIGDLMTIKEDIPPTVKVLFSGDPLVSNQMVYVTPDALIPLEFEMADDYGVGSARLMWRFADDTEFREYKPFGDTFRDLQAAPQPLVKATFELDFARLIGDLRVPAGTRASIQMFIQAFDLNQVKVSDDAPPELQGSRANTTLTYEVYTVDELRMKVSTQIRQVKTTIGSMVTLQSELLALTRDVQGRTNLLDLRGPEGERLRTDLNDAYQKQNQLLRDVEVVRDRFGVFAQVYRFNRLERAEAQKPQEGRIQTVRLLAAIAGADADLRRVLNNPLVRLEDAENDAVARLAGELVASLSPHLRRALPEDAFSPGSFGLVLQNAGIYTPGFMDSARAAYEAILDVDLKPNERRGLLVELEKQQVLTLAMLRAVQEQVKKWEGYDDILHGLRNLLKSQEDLNNDLKGAARD
ncbi:MAG: hypothetical protein KF754_05775 [Planctomycetes bacterium]|nr:hypothetical protein [Planctomycetota bacterium]